MSLPERKKHAEPPRGAQKRARQGFAKQHGVAIGAGVAAVFVIAMAVYFFLRDSNDQPVRRVQEITMVRIQPPPPPPPLPPPPQQPKMIEQPKMTEPEVKQDKPLPQPPKPLPPRPVQAPPSAPLGLDTKATGPGDSFNLAGNAGGNGLLDGGGGSQFGWYASIVQEQLQKALEANKKTRVLAEQVTVRVWANYDTGRIERVTLGASTGDPSVDAAITNDALVGTQLNQPPPRDMPMPIVIRITGRRPT